MPDGGSAFVAAAVAAVTTALLARHAVERGWIDRREGAEERKPRTAPVPLVGGAALLVALLVWDLSGGGGLPWLALIGAFVLGLVDDVVPGGLSASAKFRGQCAVGVLLMLFPAASGVEGVLDHLALAIVAVVAMNAVNTFDNSDGAASVLGLAALWPIPGARGALLGFLPFNVLLRGSGSSLVRPGLFLRDKGSAATSPPKAMLGDSGSHVLGVLIAATPGAEPLLLVPLLDLARLAFVRRAHGREPWQGDRRHLAHRLELMGLGPLAVAGCLAGLLLPTWLGARIGAGSRLLLVGMLLTTVLYFLVLYLTPDPDELAPDGSSPDSGPP
jgi:UDP-N-acetylmuramyl pentapeptide phosphotransferase/UDP-N-acetylglucosamine-1-phosphate transferase